MKITLFALFAGLLMLGGCAEESELESTRMSAEQGDADAQSNLGTNYYYGIGVPQDYKEAAKWYRKSAEQGHAMAQNHLGFMYSNGEGVPQDYKEAVKWYRKSAEQGDAKAQYNLGNSYAKGRGVPQYYKEAYAWVSVAKANGNALTVKALDVLTKKMTKEQIAEAQSLATEISKRIEANKKD
jgi:TPR repeat protein